MPVERKIILCPYCGHVNPGPAERCGGCGGFFDPLSRRVTQQHMGPWFVRDSANPFRPGCTYQVLVKQVQRGKITANTILRGPTTKQFWSVARHVPGVSHLLGVCYQCSEKVQSTDKKCPKCGARFPELPDRQQLGLDPEDAGVFEEVARARAEEQAALANQPATPPLPKEHPSMFAAPTAGPDTREPTFTTRPPAKARVIATSSTSGGGVGGVDDDLFLPGSEPEPVASRPAAAVVKPAPIGSPASADAMDWMTGSDVSPPDSIETMGQFQQAERSSNLMVWVLVGMNVLLAVVVTLVILTRNPSAPEPAPESSPGTPTETTPPAASQSPAPTSRANSGDRVSVADAGRNWDEPTTPKPAPTTNPAPKPAPKPVVTLPAPQPAPATENTTTNPEPAPPAASGGVVSFFGIKVDADANTTLSPQLAEELNQRMQKAIEADKAGRYAEALKLLKQIQADLPKGVTAEGLDESIAALQQRVDRQEIVKFLGQ